MSNLDYEYSVVMGNRDAARSFPVGSTIHQPCQEWMTSYNDHQIYVACRWCTLLAVIVQLLYINGLYKDDCQV
jgi:hypothetical protein